MSIDDFSDDIFLKWLEESVKFFRTPRIDMKASAIEVEKIIHTIKSTMQHIDKYKGC